MKTQILLRSEGNLAYDDTGGTGKVVILAPGAGDIRSEYRFLAPRLSEAGYRVVTFDLRGHGESESSFSSYRVVDTAGDILALIDHLDAGAATVIGTSFSPAAALWAAAEAPEKIKKLVLISAHLKDSSPFQNFLLNTILRGPWKAHLWEIFYKSWYPSQKPSDIEVYSRQLRASIAPASRAKAVRATLTASRDGLNERLTKVKLPALVIMGSKDSHFKNPEEEAEFIASKVSGQVQIIDGAGHYPHAEMPNEVAPFILEFLKEAT